jgi:Xaa-Pro aminopeptidase
MPVAKDTSKLLSKLRVLMRESRLTPRGLDAYIIPSSDAHGSEYLAAVDRRRAFITGFTGSSGTAVVTQNVALLWTDGRYFLQASEELDPASWTLMRDGLADTPSIDDWLAKHVPSAGVVGVDATHVGQDLYQVKDYVKY